MNSGPDPAPRAETAAFDARGAEAVLELAPGPGWAAFIAALPKIMGTSSGVRCFFAPGRVNLMGAHLDYSGGAVMPTAIDRGTFIAAHARSDGRVRLSSLVEDEVFEAPLAEFPNSASGSWFDYPLGVLRELRSNAAAEAAMQTGVELVFGGNLAIGAGLSSSASICVGSAFALDKLWGLELAPKDHVALALLAERGFVGVHCGIMDPYAVGFSRPGHLLHLDCRTQAIEHVPLDAQRYRIAVADTGVRRELASSEFNLRVAQCAALYASLRECANVDERATHEALAQVPLEFLESKAAQLDPTLVKRGRHVLTEVERTRHARAALEAGDVETFGALMTESHVSLRADYEVSVPELDCLVESAVRVPGVLGSRLTGAGFGGCTVILLEAGVEQRLRAVLERDFSARFGRAPELAIYSGDPGPREIATPID